MAKRFKLLLSGLFLCAGVLVLTACQEEPAPPPKAEVIPTYDPVKAMRRASQRMVDAEIESDPIAPNPSYLQVYATPEGGIENAERFLDGLLSDGAQTVLFLAKVKNGADFTLPAIPLYLFEKTENGWKLTFRAKGPISPWFIAKRAALTVDFDIIVMSQRLDGLTQDAEVLINQYANADTLYATAALKKEKGLAQTLSQRIALVEEQNWEDVFSLSISYLQNFATVLTLTDANARPLNDTIFGVRARDSFLPNSTTTYSEALSQTINEVSVKKAIGDLEQAFWSVPAKQLKPTCQAILGALSDRLGLSETDSAQILWAMTLAHSSFQPDIDYRETCTGPDIAHQLQEKGRGLPNSENSAGYQVSVTKMNSALTRVARFMKSPDDASRPRLTKLFDQKVLLHDQLSVFYPADGEVIVQADDAIISPSANTSDTLDYLSSLPVKTFGCYSKLKGFAATGRSSLMTLENDPNLWKLDLSFSKDSLIQSLRLKKTSQIEFCRAIGARKNKNRCVFSTMSFPNLSPDKCG